METSCRITFVSAAGEATKEKKNEEQMYKYSELLRGIQEKEKKLQEDKDVEMEITWVPGTHTCPSAPNPSLGLEIDSFYVSRSEGNDRAAGEEEAGGTESADTLGGVSAEEEREEEAEEKSEEAGEKSNTDHTHSYFPASPLSFLLRDRRK